MPFGQPLNGASGPLRETIAFSGIFDRFVDDGRVYSDLEKATTRILIPNPLSEKTLSPPRTKKKKRKPQKAHDVDLTHRDPP